MKIRSMLERHDQLSHAPNPQNWYAQYMLRHLYIVSATSKQIFHGTHEGASIFQSLLFSPSNMLGSMRR
jgi:hypothetical protein